MGAFEILAQLASTTPDFASTTGFSMADVSGVATSTLYIYTGAFLRFVQINAASLIAYMMIGMCLTIAVLAYRFYK